jgi:hypothetical protein
MKFYRAESFTTIESYGCKDLIPISYNIFINYIEFNLIKETPCGYWIIPVDYYNNYCRYKQISGKLWVSKNGKNRIAYPTKKEALFNFYKRRERYIKILRSRLNESEQILKEIELKLKKKE